MYPEPTELLLIVVWQNESGPRFGCGVVSVCVARGSHRQVAVSFRDRPAHWESEQVLHGNVVQQHLSFFVRAAQVVVFFPAYHSTAGDCWRAFYDWQPVLTHGRHISGGSTAEACRLDSWSLLVRNLPHGKDVWGLRQSVGGVHQVVWASRRSVWFGFKVLHLGTISWVLQLPNPPVQQYNPVQHKRRRTSTTCVYRMIENCARSSWLPTVPRDLNINPMVSKTVTDIFECSVGKHWNVGSMFCPLSLLASSLFLSLHLLSSSLLSSSCSLLVVSLLFLYLPHRSTFQCVFVVCCSFFLLQYERASFEGGQFPPWGPGEHVEAATVSTWRFVGHSSHGSFCGSKLLNGDDQLNATRTDSRREQSWTTLFSTLNKNWNAERCCILWGMDWNGMIPNLEDQAPRMIEKVDLQKCKKTTRPDTVWPEEYPHCQRDKRRKNSLPGTTKRPECKKQGLRLSGNWSLPGADERKPQDVRVCHTLPRDLAPYVIWIWGFSSLVPVSHRFFQELTCVSAWLRLWIRTTLSQRALVCFFLCTWLCALSHTEHQKSSLPAEQGVQAKQILFVWGHDPSTHVRRVRFLTSVGDLIWVCHCHLKVMPEAQAKLAQGGMVGDSRSYADVLLLGETWSYVHQQQLGPKADVVRPANNDGRSVHFTSRMDLCDLRSARNLRNIFRSTTDELCFWKQRQGRQRVQSTIVPRWQWQDFWIQCQNVQVWQERGTRRSISGHASARVGRSQIAEVTGEILPTSMDKTTTQSKIEQLGYDWRTSGYSGTKPTRSSFDRIALETKDWKKFWWHTLVDEYQVGCVFTSIPHLNESCPKMWTT